MTTQIALDDQSRAHLRLAGEMHVEDQQGVRLVLMTEEARSALATSGAGADIDLLLPLAHEAFSDCWDAPGMEAYEDYDQSRAKLP